MGEQQEKKIHYYGCLEEVIEELGCNIEDSQINGYTIDKIKNEIGKIFVGSKKLEELETNKQGMFLKRLQVANKVNLELYGSANSNASYLGNGAMVMTTLSIAVSFISIVIAISGIEGWEKRIKPLNLSTITNIAMGLSIAGVAWMVAIVYKNHKEKKLYKKAVIIDRAIDEIIHKDINI